MTRPVSNQVTRNADGSLRFGEMNHARTPGTRLEDVRTSGVIQIQLQADPQSLQQSPPRQIRPSATAPSLRPPTQSAGPKLNDLEREELDTRKTVNTDIHAATRQAAGQGAVPSARCTP